MRLFGSNSEKSVSFTLDRVHGLTAASKLFASYLTQLLHRLLRIIWLQMGDSLVRVSTGTTLYSGNW